MSSNIWTRSIEKPATSSVGASLPYCTKVSTLPEYARSLFFGLERGRTSVTWTEFFGEALGTHSFSFRAQETQDAPQSIPAEAIVRLYCHAMVSLLPNGALPELLEDLRDLETQFVGALQPALELSKPTVKLSAKLGTPIARPQFNADEE